MHFKEGLQCVGDWPNLELEVAELVRRYGTIPRKAVDGQLRSKSWQIADMVFVEVCDDKVFDGSAALGRKEVGRAVEWVRLVTAVDEKAVAIPGYSEYARAMAHIVDCYLHLRLPFAGSLMGSSA